jgi:hypothetical protein
MIDANTGGRAKILIADFKDIVLLFLFSASFNKPITLLLTRCGGTSEELSDDFKMALNELTVLLHSSHLVMCSATEL